MIFCHTLMPDFKKVKLKKHGKCSILLGRNDLLNRQGGKFALDNDDLSELKAVDAHLNLIHPEIILKIPVVETESMYNRIIRPIPSG